MYYSAHIVMLLLLVATIASGWIAVRTRAAADFVIFSGFVVVAAVGVVELFFGYTAQYDENMQLIEEKEGLLSIGAVLLLNVLGYFLVALGFAAKAWKLK